MKTAAIADDIVVIGAHYDSSPGTPGASDNGITGLCQGVQEARLKGRRHAFPETMGSYRDNAGSQKYPVPFS